VNIPDDVEPVMKAKASGLSLETFAEQVLLERIQAGEPQDPNASLADAARRLGTFGKRNGLSLGGMTIRDLLNESRP
jgi:hypothetical protein